MLRLWWRMLRPSLVFHNKYVYREDLVPLLDSSEIQQQECVIQVQICIVIAYESIRWHFVSKGVSRVCLQNGSNLGDPLMWRSLKDGLYGIRDGR